VSDAASVVPRLVVVAAILRREGRVLLTQRPEGTHLAGLWEFPGGKLEAGESPEQALRRECREECGVELEVGRIVEVVFHTYDDRDVLLLFYDCRLVSGEIRHLEIADHEWCPIDELHSRALPPADAPLIPRLRELEQAAPSR